ncbi:hypothetical protein J7L00_03980 [Candidatus Bathyarchaeota archaeon]|nr:hypothetical protein [Candidatus Bathyarchaeota archaeon]
MPEVLCSTLEELLDVVRRYAGATPIKINFITTDDEELRGFLKEISKMPGIKKITLWSVR